MRLPVKVVLGMAALAAAGCGDQGTTVAEPSAAVEEAVQQLLSSNDPEVCTELATQRFLESIRDQAGEEAVRGCGVEVAGRAAEPASMNVGEIVFEGSTARARLTGGAPFGTVLDLGLVEEDGAWKADTLEVVSFDRDALLADVRRETLPVARAFGSERHARCMLETLRRLNNTQLAGLALGREDALAERLNASC